MSFVALLTLCGALVSGGRATPAPGSLVAYVRARADLSPAEREGWERVVRRQFGPAGLVAESADRPELGAARSILAAGLFLEAPAERAVAAAWAGYRSVRAAVP